MKLQTMLQNVAIMHPPPNDQLAIDIQGMTDDSREVKPGFLFVAISGYETDGHKYIDDAVKSGAAVVVGEQNIGPLPVPYLKVNNSRKALGMLARNFYKQPAKNKIMIGITGTNGKTTTSYLIKHLLESCGISCALIGTIQTVINGKTEKSKNTTPSALTLHRLLAESDDDAVIMEVSSQGLDQYRVEGVTFDYTLFTNLHPEHLDYHKTMEQYFTAKKKLFNYLYDKGTAIINTEDPYGARLASELKTSGKQVYTIGTKNADVHMIDLQLENSQITLRSGGVVHSILSPLAGIHNMYNTVMAFALALQLGLDHADLKNALPNFKGVQGRFETIHHKNGSTIVIDYAHTTDAIAYCLHTAKQFGAKKITHILGFRGNRDKAKREKMLSVICEMSDEYILTFDDLNTVSPASMKQTLHKLHEEHGNDKGKIITDRTIAIQQAIENASRDDWIVITGKGHETYEQNFHLQTASDKDTVLFLTEAAEEPFEEL